MTASVSVTRRAVWRLRAGAALPRYMLCAVAAAGLAASARQTLAPPRPVVAAVPRPDLGGLTAQGFATLFARRYLTWSAADPAAHARGLSGFVGPDADPDDGLTPPDAGSQSVLWAEAVQVRAGISSARVYTVAAQTDASGLVYLTVPVIRLASGRQAIAGYPAFVGPSAVGAPDDLWASRPAVDDPALSEVVRRVVGNYLDGDRTDLAADLAPAARVSPPVGVLTLQRVADVRWSPDRRSVDATVLADDQLRATYTLGYELDVLRVGSRWEIGAIQMNPDT